MSESVPAPQAGACAIVIMAKESRPGTCKTRLVPPLSPAAAARLNTAFLQDIAVNIAAAASRRPIRGMAAFHPPGSEAFFRAILPEGFGLVPPREPGLGRSLSRTARDLLTAGWAGVAMVNADSPTLPTRYLVELTDRLAAPGDRVVLGPSDDGGYYAIGLKRFHARLFEAIDWSTERVMTQTLQRADEIGLEATVLPPWYDVDDAALLERLRRELFAQGEPVAGFTAPHARAWFESEQQEVVEAAAAG